MSTTIPRLFQVLESMGLFQRKQDEFGRLMAYNDQGASVFVSHLDHITIHFKSEEAILKLVEALEFAE